MERKVDTKLIVPWVRATWVMARRPCSQLAKMPHEMKKRDAAAAMTRDSRIPLRLSGSESGGFVLFGVLIVKADSSFRVMAGHV